MTENTKSHTPTGYPDSYVPAILTQWAAAREIHARAIEEGVAWECANEDCEHDDECPTEEFAVCKECYGISVEASEEYFTPAFTWPCPTARALGAEAN